MQDVIDLLLQKKENLRADLEREYAERESKINALLDMAGYIPPVEETATEPAPEDVGVPVYDEIQQVY